MNTLMMTNNELRQAIDATFEMWRKTPVASTAYRAIDNHLESLLKIEEARALFALNDLVEQNPFGVMLQ